MSSSYESFFGFVERPFSLTSDPTYFFRSRSHGRALETLTFALRSRERFLLVTGDLGVGKTVLCRTLMDQLRRRGLVSYAASPLLNAASVLRLLLEDFGALNGEGRRGHTADASDGELHGMLVDFFRRLHSHQPEAVLIIDEAHLMPPAFVEQVLSLAALELNGEKILQLVLVGQAAAGEPGRLGVRALDDALATRVRLLPLDREECAEYVAHRLTIAGGSREVAFSTRAIELIFALSGGVPRLVNLLCERALQEAAAAGAQKIEPAMVDRAVSALELLRARPRRFRWFNRRIS